MKSVLIALALFTASPSFASVICDLDGCHTPGSREPATQVDFEIMNCQADWQCRRAVLASFGQVEA